MLTMLSIPSLRHQLRRKRRQLTKQQQRAASLAVCRNLLRLPCFINAKRIALYLSNDGEISVEPLFYQARAMGKKLYLPVLHPLNPGELVFMAFHQGQSMALNKYGIPEPVSDANNRCKTWMLDLVLTPLVGFDAQGNRLGMGGGYYDRSFAFVGSGTKPRQPWLIGVAHECQKVAGKENVGGLRANSWDIPMHAIVTDEKFYGCN